MGGTPLVVGPVPRVGEGERFMVVIKRAYFLAIVSSTLAIIDEPVPNPDPACARDERVRGEFVALPAGAQAHGDRCRDVHANSHSLRRPLLVDHRPYAQGI